VYTPLEGTHGHSIQPEVKGKKMEGEKTGRGVELRGKRGQDTQMWTPKTQTKQGLFFWEERGGGWIKTKRVA